MFGILEKTKDFIEDIKQSDIYIEYQKAYAELERNPELLLKADTFRKEHFLRMKAMQQPVCFADVESVEKDYEEIAVYPEIKRFLEAELALCRLLQRIQEQFVVNLDFK